MEKKDTLCDHDVKELLRNQQLSSSYMSHEYDNVWATSEMSWSMKNNNTEMGLGLI